MAKDNLTEQVLVRLSPDQLKAIDVWRKTQDNPPSRPEALRQLAMLSLKRK
jgi:hypothetical protein